MQLRSSRRFVGLFAVLFATAIVSAVVLMEQIQPAVPVASQLSPGCTPRTSPTPVNVTLGSSGQMTFSCSSSAPASNPAFRTGGPVRAIPTITGFVAPYNTTRLYIYKADGPTNTGFCFARTGNQKIDDGQPEDIPAGNWNYCAEYENVGPNGLPEFKVSWHT